MSDEEDSSDNSSDSHRSFSDTLILTMIVIGFEDRNWEIMRMLILYLLRERFNLQQDEDDEEDDEEDGNELEESNKVNVKASHKTTAVATNTATRGRVIPPTQRSTNLSNQKTTVKQTNSSTPKPVAPALAVSKSRMTPQQPSQGSAPLKRKLPSQGGQPTRSGPPVSTLTVANVAAHNARFSPSPKRASPMWHPAQRLRMAAPSNVRPSNAMNLPARDANMQDQRRTDKRGSSGQQQLKAPCGPPGLAASSSGKRLVPNDKGKQMGRPRKKVKKSEDGDPTERCAPESCLQVDDMIEIEEPRIKDEIFETEEFNEVKREKILPFEELVQEKVNFETVYCTPGIVKVERPDNVESPDSCNAADDNLVPDFMQTVIKTEPREEEEYEEEDVMNTAVEPRTIPPLMWRCPLVSCTEMFNNELEMYQHLNLNHTVKGVSLLPKSKKAPEPVATGGLSIHPPVIPSPEAICSSDKLFLESAMSSPSVPTTTMVMTNQSVPCSSSAPVTTTTTFSYSSLTTSSPLLVTTVSSLTSTTMCSSVPQCAQVTASSTSPLLCPSTVLPSSDSNTMPSSVSNTMPDCSGSPDICDTTDPLSLETDPLAPDTAPQGLTKLIVVPITSQSTGSKQFLLMTPHDPKSIQNSSTKSSQPLQVYQTPEISTDDLLPCATDESEMFSISLAQFPENRRIPIKHKLLEVVDCIKKKNIGPEKLLIAYHENNDSRSV